MKAYLSGFDMGYKDGCKKGNSYEKRKDSILTEEEEAGAAKMGKIGFTVEQIRSRIQYLRKKEIEWVIRSILDGRKEEGALEK